MSQRAGNPERVRRRGRRPRSVLRIGAVAVAVLVVALPAAGDTPSTRTTSNDSRLATPKPPSFGGDDDIIEKGILIQQTTTGVSKAKVQFVFPDVYLHANFVLCISGVNLDSWLGGDLAQKACAPQVKIPLPEEYQTDAAISALQGGAVYGYVVTKSDTGRKTTYGSFPPVKVNGLVFGSIPVSATVHLEQTSTNGILDPIVANYGTLGTLVTEGSLAFPGFPRVPPATGSRATLLVYKNDIDATLRLRLSDVAVDGRPVDVGSRCGTESPVRLTVREARGYYSEGTIDLQTRGKPGAFRPATGSAFGVIDHPGYFNGNANVPAFSGCGTRTEDLDPLLTALISSSTNPVSGYLPDSVLSEQSDWCTTPPGKEDCTPALAAGQRRMRAVAAAIAAHKGRAEIRKLAAKIKPSDYELPKVKANGSS